MRPKEGDEDKEEGSDGGGQTERENREAKRAVLFVSFSVALTCVDIEEPVVPEMPLFVL